MTSRASLTPKGIVPGLLPALLLALTVPARSAPEELSVTGYLAGRAILSEGPASWLDGGFGRLATGAEGPGESETDAQGQLHVALDYTSASRFGFYVHGVARAEPDIAEGRAAGFVEAFLHGSFALRSSDRLRFQLGHFILPTSRENVEVAWSSPYTLTFSALNTWIGEDVRLTGLLSEYSLAVGSIDELRFGASLFGGNDAAGALLAWRGWALGDRLTTFGEVVPLPPLDSLELPGPFYEQLDRGTQPFGSDLDSRPGWAGYLAFVRPQKARIQWSRYDNRGDRELHNGDEYAWTTEFDAVGAEFHPSPTWSLAGEVLSGSTGMGERAGPHVQLDMEAAYLLASFRPGDFRLTLRYDRFETIDRDLTDADVNDEDGEAWTLAFFWEPTTALRVGLEILDLESDRPEAAASGFDLSTDARSVTLEVRYYLDW